MRTFVSSLTIAILLAGILVTAAAAALPADGLTAEFSEENQYPYPGQPGYPPGNPYQPYYYPYPQQGSPIQSSGGYVYGWDPNQFSRSGYSGYYSNYYSSYYSGELYNPYEAYTGSASVSLSSTLARVGGTITAHVTGFPEYVTVEFRLGRFNQDISATFKNTTDGNGSVTQEIAIPADAEPDHYWSLRVIAAPLQVYSKTIYVIE